MLNSSLYIIFAPKLSLSFLFEIILSKRILMSKHVFFNKTTTLLMLKFVRHLFWRTHVCKYFLLGWLMIVMKIWFKTSQSTIYTKQIYSLSMFFLAKLGSDSLQREPYKTELNHLLLWIVFQSSLLYAVPSNPSRFILLKTLQIIPQYNTEKLVSFSSFSIHCFSKVNFKKPTCQKKLPNVKIWEIYKLA